jgi:hypothetical protein
MEALNLRLIGFCGADDSVAPELLTIISKQFAWVEWGLLFRSDLEGTARYPSLKWVESLLECNKFMHVRMNLAAHLCRDRCQQVLEGDQSFVASLSHMGFQRMQINATAANGVLVDPQQLSRYAANIMTVVRAQPYIEWIFQLNDETQPLWLQLLSYVPNNMSMLYDASCGKGVQIQSFPSPSLHPGIRCGYAGGIGPQTIDTVLTAVIQVARTSVFPVWIDMESSLRVWVSQRKDGEVQDEFSISHCMRCITIALRHGMGTIQELS